MARRKPSTSISESDSDRAIKPRPASTGDLVAPPLATPFNPASRGHVILVCILLFLVTAWAFLPSLRNGFVEYDDDGYVTANTHVTSGLTLENARWAFTNLDIGLWHPLTWLSHMLDCQWFGLRPGGHHLTSLLLHAANTALLFVVLRRMTGARWRSALVAALFALHPLHVESVAWVAERKDVLSTFFVMLTLWAYSRYAERSAISSQ